MVANESKISIPTSRIMTSPDYSIDSSLLLPGREKYCNEAKQMLKEYNENVS